MLMETCRTGAILQEISRHSSVQSIVRQHFAADFGPLLVRPIWFMAGLGSSQTTLWHFRQEWRASASEVRLHLDRCVCEKHRIGFRLRFHRLPWPILEPQSLEPHVQWHLHRRYDVENLGTATWCAACPLSQLRTYVEELAWCHGIHRDSLRHVLYHGQRRFGYESTCCSSSTQLVRW